jgi:cell division protein FtsQ
MKFKKRNKRKLSAIQHIKRWFMPVFLPSLLALISWNIYHYNPGELLKVDANWTIDNAKLVTQETLEKQIEPLVDELYQLDLHEIKSELERHPWVLSAQVKRLFWDAISIKITTHKVATLWENLDCHNNQQDNNCQGYVTTQGRLITPKNLFYHQQSNNTPHLITLKSSYNLEKSEPLLNDYYSYQKILNDMKLNTFVRSNIDSLRIAPNITVVLGYSKQTQRLQKFIKIYEKLRKKIPLKRLKKSTYDMRYPKGFTLKY